MKRQRLLSSEQSTSQAQMAIRVKGNKKCHDHKDNDVVFLCQDCKVFICLTCSLSIHKEHVDSFLELSNIKSQKQHIIQEFVNETDNVNIPKLNKEIVLSKTRMSSCKPMYDKLRKDVSENDSECKLQLDEIADNYISIYDKMELVSTDIIQSHITNLEERLDDLKKLCSEYKQTVQSGTTVLMYDSVSEIREMDSDIPPPPDLDMADFTPGIDRRSHLKQAMGTIKIDTRQSESTNSGNSDQLPVVRPKQSTETGQASTEKVRPKQSTESGQASTGVVQYKLCDRPILVSKFAYPDQITSICPTPAGRTWLCSFTSNKLKLIDNKGQVITTFQHNTNIRNISVDPTTGRLWFCCWDSRTICEISSSCSVVKRFNIKDANPGSLCMTREGRVVVGTEGKQKGYKVMMFTSNGRVLQEAILEKLGAGVVRSITQCCVTGNIAVVSSKLISGDGSDPGNYRRHIIVYNPTLQPLVHYRGEGIEARGEVRSRTFGPIAVVYDSKGNIVIAEWKRKTIELISGAGKYIKTLHTNKGSQGAVGIQKDDVLWTNLEFDTGKMGLKLLKYYSD
ncbi:uncharacterized protein LOC117339031 [Pecten maximus]|uniref:uncharacterized protein LOC117339031 n=1 Tax=Pecten maximus TaxID=6579 RepID=UPI0014582108|nr:uncharacterized protein LOC117339031 [Pecten maximus]